jgi:hypothetical protein
MRPYLKNPIIKNRACGVTHVVEHLPSKYEAVYSWGLNSNPSAAKKEKRKEFWVLVNSIFN